MATIDPERLTVWRQFVTAQAQLRRRLVVALDHEHGMQLPLFEALNALREGGGRMRVMELADRLAASPASISRQLNSLADAGYVRRERPTNMDNRAVVVVLTKEGREAWRTANTVYLRVVKKHFLSHLGDADVAAMRQAFDGILAE